MTSIAVQERQGSLKRGLGLGLAAGCLLLWSGLAQAAPVPESFSGLAKEVTPAVVNIASAHAVEAQQQMPFQAPPGSPFEEFFKQFQDPNRDETMTALGSGFIIDPTGYIVTNNHVVENATEVTVRLGDDSVYAAKVVGVDPQTDVALLKIEADRELPSVPLGDSDAAEVGDWVMAVGNPFGLGGSVTAGIISARGRDIDAGPYDDFLQIDASINHGNSGGPLFDMDGKVIGVNTAIYSPNGGSVGIGFAIPSNIVKSVVAELKEDGKVDRGYLGVMLQPITPELASALGLEKAEGAMVADILPDGPAAKSDLRKGDVILSFAGKDVSDPRGLARAVAAEKAGEKVSVTVWRDGERHELSVTPGEQPTKDQASVEPETGQEDGSYHSAALDADLAQLTPEWREQLGLESDVEGVVVVDIKAARPFEEGLRPGDVIMQVDRTDVSKPAEVEKLLDEAKAEQQEAVLLLVSRQGQDLYLGLQLKA
ncbi:MAG TPA: DegQ family serine endoprotease [Kiloniellales bacterium]|nr:DegQ family serine endoprotease [Kiloniellales bacterium]